MILDSSERRPRQLDCYLFAFAHRFPDPLAYGADLQRSSSNERYDDDRVATHHLRLTSQKSKRRLYCPWAKNRLLGQDHPFHVFQKATSREYHSDIPVDAFVRWTCVEHRVGKQENSRAKDVIRKLCHHFKDTLPADKKILLEIFESLAATLYEGAY